MKRFIIQICAFFMLYIITSLILLYFTPYHWGNPWYSSKIQFLENNDHEEFNTFFFGSSLIYRHLNPNVFDSTYNSLGHDKIKSFNLGAPATFNPQSYYLYEHFLNSHLSENVKYCFLELREVDLLGDDLMHQERTTYWQNIKDLLFAGNSIYSNDEIATYQKFKSTINYSISYFENIFHIGGYGKQIVTPSYYDNRFVGFNNNGYLSLEDDYKTTSDPVVKNNFLERNNSIKNNPELVDDRKKTYLQAYQHISTKYDKVNLDRIIGLIEKSKQQGIKLIFILTSGPASPQLIKLSTKIPKNNLIDMAKPSISNKLYVVENLFDVAHFNTKGSTVYSEWIAQEFGKNKN